jgi:hypothetical protein
MAGRARFLNERINGDLKLHIAVFPCVFVLVINALVLPRHNGPCAAIAKH